MSWWVAVKTFLEVVVLIAVVTVMDWVINQGGLINLVRETFPR